MVSVVFLFFFSISLSVVSQSSWLERELEKEQDTSQSGDIPHNWGHAQTGAHTIRGHTSKPHNWGHSKQPAKYFLVQVMVSFEFLELFLLYFHKRFWAIACPNPHALKMERMPQKKQTVIDLQPQTSLSQFGERTFYILYFTFSTGISISIC